RVEGVGRGDGAGGLAGQGAACRPGVGVGGLAGSRGVEDASPLVVVGGARTGRGGDGGAVGCVVVAVSGDTAGRVGPGGEPAQPGVALAVRPGPGHAGRALRREQVVVVEAVVDPGGHAVVGAPQGVGVGPADGVVGVRPRRVPGPVADRGDPA